MMAEAGSSKAPMQAKSGRPGEVAIVSWPTVQDEIDGLATWINSRRGTRRSSLWYRGASLGIGCET